MLWTTPLRDILNVIYAMVLCTLMAIAPDYKPECFSVALAEGFQALLMMMTKYLWKASQGRKVDCDSQFESTVQPIREIMMLDAGGSWSCRIPSGSREKRSWCSAHILLYIELGTSAPGSDTAQSSGGSGGLSPRWLWISTSWQSTLTTTSLEEDEKKIQPHNNLTDLYLEYTKNSKVHKLKKSN